MYKVIREPKYDFIGQSYASSYPNLHKYPATMIPHLGIELFKDLEIKTNAKLLDPYCGSGSSFVVGLEAGIKQIYGNDINPLATLISKAKFTKLNIDLVKYEQRKIRESVFEKLKDENYINNAIIPNITNVNYWFSTPILANLSVIKHFIDEIKDNGIKQLFLVPFSETVRECSYTRNNEFKLYRIKSDEIQYFNPDVTGVFFLKLAKVIDIYEKYYFPLILSNAEIVIENSAFTPTPNFYDVVLTSPPYGDSKTTVAYGQFSCLSNEWLGFVSARQIDNMLMGGKKTKKIYEKGIISDCIKKIESTDNNRALEVSSFYFDLDTSIKNVAKSIKKNGTAIYIVGNRRVKDTQLLTDQFVAEKFEENGFEHFVTYERALTSKAMPLRNSPTNKIGATKGTMTQEFIVICKKM
jgi:DNA modification methylase